MREGAKMSVGVAGVGHTTFGRLPEEDEVTLGVWALREALADAGFTMGDIDGLVTHRVSDYPRFCRATGLVPKFLATMPPHGRMTGVSIQLAAHAILSGVATTVALVYGNNGRSAGERYGGLGERYGGGADQFWFPYGMTSPGAVHALLYQQYMNRFGGTPERLAPISVAFRRHAALNPSAVLRKPVTQEDHDTSRLICAPLRLLDYCLINDGGVAMIMTAADRVRDCKQPPVYLRGFAQESRLAAGEFPEDFGRSCMQSVADRVHRMAGTERADVDGLMIYDNFTPTVVFNLEGYGFCLPGEGLDFVAGGRIELGGRMPCNTNGGHLSESYMQGWSLNVEAVRQLRGQCAGRQIKNVELIQYIAGGPISTSMIYGNVQ